MSDQAVTAIILIGLTLVGLGAAVVVILCEIADHLKAIRGEREQAKSGAEGAK